MKILHINTDRYDLQMSIYQISYKLAYYERFYHSRRYIQARDLRIVSLDF